MKASEYGGSDTDKTFGIQPAPHVMTAAEQLRMLYRGDPMDVAAPVPGPVSVEDLGK